MSRTYRKVPHFVTKESLHKDFNDGFYRVFHCGMTFQDADDYAKSALAKEKSDSGIFHVTGLSDVMAIAPNGAALGYKEMPQKRWVKRYTNKIRRATDKAIITEAVDEMVEDGEAAIQELKEMLEYESEYYYEDSSIFDDDPYDCMYPEDDWNEPDDWYDPHWDDYDPW